MMDACSTPVRRRKNYYRYFIGQKSHTFLLAFEGDFKGQTIGVPNFDREYGPVRDVPHMQQR